MPDDCRRSDSPISHNYIVDGGHRIVHLDRKAACLYPGAHTGDLCYQSMHGRTVPCENCPVEDGKDHSIAVQYDDALHQWFEDTCVPIEWTDGRPCFLHSCRPIDSTARNLLAALCRPTSYDELYALNLTKRTFRTLFQEPGKYVAAPEQGPIELLAGQNAAPFVHPDDLAKLNSFFNHRTMLDRMERDGGALYGEFRRTLQNGGTGLAGITLVPVKRGERGDIIVMAFVGDVDATTPESTSHKPLRLTAMSERDPLTGLYSAQVFFNKAEKLLKNAGSDGFTVLYANIEHFKLYNEWYGRAAGDAALVELAQNLMAAAVKHGGMAGYFGGDNFALIIPQAIPVESDLGELLHLPLLDLNGRVGFQPAIGVCVVRDANTPVASACDHAMEAASSVRGTYAKRVAWYMPAMTEELEAETKILMEAKEGLERDEFTVYWQPQCSTYSGRIVGLEALLRWQHPERGLVMPGDFVPALERNGFIANIDRFVWEEVCRRLRQWIDAGKTPLPVSVNISRADLYAINVSETIVKLVEQYGLDRDLLRLEITESAYAEDERVSDTVNRMKELGFTVLMDDFGSGYSSLNMLRDINVDVIKIDMGFLNREQDPQRGESILEAIVSMAKLMDLRVIAEGVETPAQASFLRDIGCDYAQGFHYYRPMDTEALELLIDDEGIIDPRGVTAPSLENIDMEALLRESAANRSIIDHLIGGMAVYAVHDPTFELLQVNSEYCHVTGSDPTALGERQQEIWKQVHPDDRAIALRLFSQAEKHPVTGAEGVVRRFRGDGGVMWMRLRVFFLSRQQGRRLFYAAVEDVTEQRQRELEALGAVTSDSQVFELLNANSVHHWCINVSRWSFLTGRDRELFFKETGVMYSDWSGFRVGEVFSSIISSEADRDAVDQFLDQHAMLKDFKHGVNARKLEYRQQVLVADDGTPLGCSIGRADGDGTIAERWCELQYHLMRVEGSNDVYANVHLMDIHERKERELKLIEQAQHDALTGLLNRRTSSERLERAISSTVEDGRCGALVVVDIDDFKDVNDTHGHTCGDAALADIGAHLRASFRKRDIICRWGGDEFVVYCDDIPRDEIVRRVANLCHSPWTINIAGVPPVELSASAGIALAPEHGTELQRVFEHADAALYQAKTGGKAQYAVYESGMQPQIAND